MDNNEEILKKINDGEYKLLKKNGKSIIWTCFLQIQKADGSFLQDRVICRMCNKLYKFEKNQTSNLMKHKCVHNQPHNSIPKQVNGEDKNACFEAFMDFTIEDCRPFSIFEGSGFRKMIAKLLKIGAKYGENVDLDHLIPSARTLSRKSKMLAAEKKQEIQPHIQNLITNGEAAFTIDMCTDDFNKRNFLCVTLHYQVNFNLVEITLGIKSMDFMSSTAVNVREKLSSIFEEFGVTDLSNAVFVTDQGSNIISALKDYTRLNCSAHLFSHVLNKAFESTEELTDITKTCKKIVKYFKKANKQHLLNTTLKSQCSTRCNSNFAIFKSIFENYTEVNEILAEKDETRSMLNFNFSVLQSLVELCQNFELIFKNLQESVSPTLCFVIPSINKIKMLCVKENNEETAIASLKRNILSHLEKWISNISNWHKAALLLYPPAISMQSNEVHDIKEFCIAKLRENHWKNSSNFSLIHTPAVCMSPNSNLSQPSLQPHSPIQVSSSSSLSPSEPTARKESFFFPNLILSPESNLETERDEVERYCNEKVILTEDFDVMLWWENNICKYPKLSKLAIKILSIPATSAASERVFSLAGNIITEKRNRLEPKTVDSIMFLNSLYEKNIL